MERILSPASAGFLMFAYQKDTFFFSIHNFRLYLAPNADKHKKGWLRRVVSPIFSLFEQRVPACFLLRVFQPNNQPLTPNEILSNVVDGDLRSVSI
jgi:hypothetical protein